MADFVGARAVLERYRQRIAPALLHRARFPQELVKGFEARINPYRLPGVSVRLGLERARGQAQAKRKPSDFLDADHIMLAPYVDLMLPNS